jgi:hypothetical protein
VCANTSNFCVGQFLLAASQVSRLSTTNATKDDIIKTDDEIMAPARAPLAPAPPAPGCASIKASATVRNKQRGLFGAIFEYGTKTITFPRQAQDTYLDLHSTQKVENPRRFFFAIRTTRSKILGTPFTTTASHRRQREERERCCRSYLS